MTQTTDTLAHAIAELHVARANATKIAETLGVLNQQIQRLEGRVEGIAAEQGYDPAELGEAVRTNADGLGERVQAQVNALAANAQAVRAAAGRAAKPKGPRGVLANRVSENGNGEQLDIE